MTIETGADAMAGLFGSPARHRDDYRLVDGAGDRAVAAGLANAAWYRCPVPRAVMKDLMKRSDGPAIRDTALWFSVVAAAGAAMWALKDSGWFIAAFLVYAALYCGPADARWHEAGHGTAFKTRWMNDALYQVACFMVLRRPTRWRWSHARHHTDTLVVGRDPEIAVPRPTELRALLMSLFALEHAPRELWRAAMNAAGRLDAEEKTFVPETEWPKMIREARIWMAIWLAVIAAAVAMHSAMPLFTVGLPSFAGAWLYVFFGLTQHTGLPENVLDHRLNCRTVRMNPVFRFLYWNMNHHLEHHMFPMVPYHALPRLHEAIKADCPPVYRSTLHAYAEIVPALIRQAREPDWHVVRTVPASSSSAA